MLYFNMIEKRDHRSICFLTNNTLNYKKYFNIFFDIFVASSFNNVSRFSYVLKVYENLILKN